MIKEYLVFLLCKKKLFSEFQLFYILGFVLVVVFLLVFKVNLMGEYVCNI